MRVRLSDAVYCERVDDEAVLLDMESGTYFALDAIGARLWELLGQRGTTEGAVDAAVEEYDVDREQLERDLDELVRALAAEHLLEIVDA